MGFWTEWLRLQRSQWFNRRRLERLQLKALRQVVRHAYSTIPFYRKLYRSASIDPSDLNSFDDLARFPTVSKEEFRATPIEERLSSEFSASECFRRRTSGSTGQPMEILYEPRAVDVMRAYQLRRILSYGFMPWEKIAMLDPRRVDKPSKGHAYRSEFTRFLPGGGLYEVPMLSPSEQIDAIRKLRPRGIWALPSALRSLGTLIDSEDLAHFDLRAILSMGELLDMRTRKLVESRFGAPIFDGYGTVDTASFGLAWECREHGFHINADCAMLEFLRDEEPVSVGERGEIVATALFRFAMPAIRYKVQDYAVPTDEICNCGRNFPLLKALEGRKVDCLVAESGELVSPFRVIVALEEIEEVGRYQIVQEERDHVVVNIEALSPIPSETVEKTVRVCRSLVGASVRITVNTVSAIIHEPGRKFQPVICKVQETP